MVDAVEPALEAEQKWGCKEPVGGAAPGHRRRGDSRWPLLPTPTPRWPEGPGPGDHAGPQILSRRVVATTCLNPVGAKNLIRIF
jgi:hypothetical protein